MNREQTYYEAYCRLNSILSLGYIISIWITIVALLFELPMVAIVFLTLFVALFALVRIREHLSEMGEL